MAKPRNNGLRIQLIRKLCQNCEGGVISSTSAYSKSQAINIGHLDSRINACIKIQSTFCAVDVSSLQNKTILMYDQMAIALLRVLKSCRVTCTPNANGLKLKMVSIIIPEHKAK